MIIFLVRVSPVNVKFTADIALERRLVANLVIGVLNIVSFDLGGNLLS
jgi:hypothetical protein